MGSLSRTSNGTTRACGGGQRPQRKRVCFAQNSKQYRQYDQRLPTGKIGGEQYVYPLSLIQSQPDTRTPDVSPSVGRSAGVTYCCRHTLYVQSVSAHPTYRPACMTLPQTVVDTPNIPVLRHTLHRFVSLTSTQTVSSHERHYDRGRKSLCPYPDSSPASSNLLSPFDSPSTFLLWFWWWYVTQARTVSRVPFIPDSQCPCHSPTMRTDTFVSSLKHFCCMGCATQKENGSPLFLLYVQRPHTISVCAYKGRRLDRTLHLH